MRLGFFKECMVSLIFLGINLLSLSVSFFWFQLKLWFASQQCLAISLLSQSQFLTDLLCSFEREVGIFTLNMRDIIIYVALWWEKYLSKRSPLKHTCSWHDKLIALWILNRQAKISLCIHCFCCWLVSREYVLPIWYCSWKNHLAFLGSKKIFRRNYLPTNYSLMFQKSKQILQNFSSFT